MSFLTVCLSVYLGALHVDAMQVITTPKEHWTSLHMHLAAERGDVAEVASWLDRGAHVDAAFQPAIGDAGGITMLMIASMRGHVALVDFLLEHGASVDLQNKHGTTALAGAAAEGHDTIVRRLRRAGARTELVDSVGTTAHDWAKRGSHAECVQALTEGSMLPLKAQSCAPVRSLAIGVLVALGCAWGAQPREKAQEQKNGSTAEGHTDMYSSASQVDEDTSTSGVVTVKRLCVMPPSESSGAASSSADACSTPDSTFDSSCSPPSVRSPIHLTPSQRAMGTSLKRSDCRTPAYRRKPKTFVASPAPSTFGADGSCVICMDASKTHAAFPCGHQILCGDCAAKMEHHAECPGCRERVMGWALVRKM